MSSNRTLGAAGASALVAGIPLWALITGRQVLVPAEIAPYSSRR